MIEEDVKSAFELLWKAKREFAAAQHQQSLAEQTLDIRRTECERAKDALDRADERLQRLAARAAGIDGLIADADEPVPIRTGFRPVHR